MSDIEVEIDDGVSVVIGNDVEVPTHKRKRGKAVEQSKPPKSNYKLTINLHLIGATSNGDQLTKSRKSIEIKIEDAGIYIENVDLEDARNNVERPYISARIAHGLVINHLGQKAARKLSEIASGVGLSFANNSNPEYLVRAVKFHSQS